LGNQHRQRHVRDNGGGAKSCASSANAFKELPITEEQAVTLVKSGFTNLEGLHAADVQDLVDILSVDEAKAREIHDAVHKQDVTQEAGSAQGA
jgi:hypothetical protein